MSTATVQHRAFIVLLIMVTLAFFALLAPFFGAVLWAGIFAIIFMPLQNRMHAKMPHSPTLASLCTLTICIVVAIIPLIAITLSLVHEGTSLYQRIQSEELDFGAYLDRLREAAPRIEAVLARIGVDFAEIRDGLKSLAAASSKGLARNAVNLGQISVSFMISFAVMLYVLFFLLRDGNRLARQIHDAIPLSEEHKHRLFRKFGEVVRATIKGNVLVAIIQGTLGGLIFWALGIQGALLWGALMAILSLLPAVGAALIWLPVAVYFLLTGSIWQGVVLVIFGVGPIGLADNLLRPRLVGQQTQLPDYLILVTTLGGLALMGISGFVIGPLIAALFIAVWDLSLSEFSDRQPPAAEPPPALPGIEETDQAAG